ncbi:MAG: hypothetical protein ABSH28_19690 [Acidobacteriota bacterium]
MMVRGIERTSIFRDDTDRADFVARLARLAEHGAFTVYAWALLPKTMYSVLTSSKGVHLARRLDRSVVSTLSTFYQTISQLPPVDCARSQVREGLGEEIIGNPE